ncbi:hypothetical protein GCM10020256_12910 [Streptomyces thermocoprophilus]
MAGDEGLLGAQIEVGGRAGAGAGGEQRGDGVPAGGHLGGQFVVGEAGVAAQFLGDEGDEGAVPEGSPAVRVPYLGVGGAASAAHPQQTSRARQPVHVPALVVAVRFGHFAQQAVQQRGDGVPVGVQGRISRRDGPRLAVGTPGRIARRDGRRVAGGGRARGTGLVVGRGVVGGGLVLQVNAFHAFPTVMSGGDDQYRRVSPVLTLNSEPGSPPVHRPTAEDDVAADLAAVRPALLPRFTAELPGARSAVLTRLWRAFAYEPLPWIRRREAARDGLTLWLADGRRLHGPPSDPYATGDRVTAVELDGVPYTRPELLTAALGVPHATGLAAELGHSTASLALSRAGQEPPGDAWPEPDREWEWEQRVVDGHPYHPNCRSRPGFSVAEQLAYGPEHRPVVRLGLLPVPASECLVSGAWPGELRDGERLLLPVHPWQAAHVLKRGR